MGPLLSSAGLFANMSPPVYRVVIPHGREAVYQFAAGVFLSLAIATGGLWLVRGRRLRTRTRRVLLWLVAGGLAVGYSAWWVWEHRGHTIVSPSWADWVAMSMPLLWVLLTAAVLFVGLKSARGTPGSWQQRSADDAETVAAPVRGITTASRGPEDSPPTVAGSDAHPNGT